LRQPSEGKHARAAAMKIAFFGSSLVSSYWNGDATYYRGLPKALAGLGHDVTIYERDAFDRQLRRDDALLEGMTQKDEAAA
jgi:spore maturation protein CgeB